MAEPRRIYRTIARAAQQRPPSNAAFSAAEDRGTDSLNAPSVAGAAAAAADSRYDRSEPARPEPPAPAGKPASASVGDDARIVPPASRNHRPSGKAAHQKAPLEGELAPQATEGCIATSPDQYPNGETAAPSAADKPAQPESVKPAQGAAPLRHRQNAATPPLAGEAFGGRLSRRVGGCGRPLAGRCERRPLRRRLPAYPQERAVPALPAPSDHIASLRRQPQRRQRTER